jgi:hypothetical protein
MRTCRRLIYLVTGVAVVLVVSGAGRAVAATYRAGDLLYRNPRTSKWLIQDRILPPAKSLGSPFAVDLTAQMPPVGNQANQGSCVAWAMGYYHKTHTEWLEHHWNDSLTQNQASPAFIYNQICGGVDQGSFFEDAGKLLCEQGAGSMHEFPYNDGNCTNWPAESVFLHGISWRAEGNYWIDVSNDTGIARVKARLDSGFTTTLGIWVWGNFDNISSYSYTYCRTQRTGSNRGGHAVTFVGYDDTRTTADGTGAFRMVNSWGTGWGQSGYFWMSYQAVKDSDVEGSHGLSQGEAYYVGDKIGYTPTLLGRVQVNHNFRDCIQIRLGVGRTSAPLWSWNFRDFYMRQYRVVPQAFPGNSIVFDMTDGASYLTNGSTDSVFVRCLDDSGDSRTGTISYFSGQYVPWAATGVSVDTPVSIPDHNSAVYARARIPAYHDVSCFGVYGLPAMMDSGTSYTPVCSIVNNSYTPENRYPVHMRVGAGSNWFYDASLSAPSLQPGQKARVQFASSVVWPRGSWTQKCSTERVVDTNRVNDKASAAVQSEVRDVGCSRIEFPHGTIDSGASITPACSVYNYGSTTESGYLVRMLVGTGPSYVYTGTATVSSHGPGQRLYITLPTVTANWPRGTYAVNCSTELTGDVNSGDNRAPARSVTIQVRDVGCTKVEFPYGTIDSGASITPACSVYNYGSTTESYTVRMLVGTGPSYIYNGTASVSSHGSGQRFYVTFSTLTVNWPRGAYAVNCSTELTGDVNSGDNRAPARSTTVQVRDVGCTRIEFPYGTIDSGASITPACSVYNYGSTTESYTVRMLVGTGPSYVYTGTATVSSHGPGQRLYVTFSTNNANWARGTYAVNCSTELTGDVNSANNRAAARSVTIQVRDVGCTKVEFPYGTIDSGASITPACSVYNYGSITESGYLVRMLVGTGPSYVYTGTATVSSHGPGQRLYITLPTVTANWPRGTYAVNCSTELTGDVNSGDNRAPARSVTVQVHDVGVARILAPQGAIDSGQSVTPACSVADFGTALEASYAVRMKVGTAPTYVYNQTATVANHHPGEVLYVAFPSSSVWPRGTYPVTCSTELASDASRANDRLSGGSITVGVHDVAGTRVVAPSGTIDSGTSYTPVCSLANLGTHTEAGYQVHLRVGNAPAYVYDDAATAPSLSPGARGYLSFTPTSVWPRGTWPVTCSTELAADANPANDRSSAGSVVARVHDVTCFRVEVPTSPIDSGVGYTPACSVANRGSVTEAGYSVHLTVGRAPNYLFDERRTAPSLAPGQTGRIAFTPKSDWRRGNWPVNCSTELAGDANAFNDRAPTDTLMVTLHDVGCTMIVYPVGVIDSGQVIAPACSLFNYGTFTESGYRVRMRVGTAPAVVYDTSATGPSLTPGATGYLVFPGAVNWPRGNYPVVCSTQMANDGNRSNDRWTGTTSIQVRDVRALAVVTPVGTTYQNVPFQAVGSVLNSGTRSESLTTHFDIRLQGAPVLSGQVSTVLSAGQQADVAVFAGSLAMPGTYDTRCWTELGPDMHHENDTARGQVTVLSDVPFGWTRKTDVLTGPRQKNVKDGAALAFARLSGNDTGFVFALKGNNTREVYRYNTVTSTWVAGDSLPLMDRYAKKKGVKNGASLVASLNGTFYATKGNNTYAFWQLDLSRPQSTRWQEQADVPTGAKPVKDGGSAVAVKVHYANGSDTNWVYLLKGAGTYEFYRYNTVTNTWHTLASAPSGHSAKPYKKGSCLTYDGGDTIYCLKGGVQELFAYSISGLSWVAKDTLPRGAAKKKTGGGTGLASGDRVLYCLKGNNCDEFWTYPSATHTWSQATSMGAGNKRVNGGGALVYAESKSALYAFRGNNTLEFWAYGTQHTFARLLTPADPSQDGAMSNATSPLADFSLVVTPNPFVAARNPLITYSLSVAGNVSLGLYDITGKLVSTLVSGYRRAGSYSCSLFPAHYSLANGVYLLKFETEGHNTTKKLVVE